MEGLAQQWVLARTLPSLPFDVCRRRSTDTAASPSDHVCDNSQQLVLCQPSAIVIWDRRKRHLAARELTREGGLQLVQNRSLRCPLCGQEVNVSNFYFQAQTYFKVLQDLFAFRCSPTPPSPPSQSNSHEPQLLPAASNPFISRAAECSSSSDDVLPRNIPMGLFLTGYYGNFFEEVRQLGSGSFGQVFLCRHRMDDVQLGEYAVKKVPVGDNKDWLVKMLREVKIRERLRNTNVVDYKHSWLELHRGSPFMPKIPWLFVLMEYCNGGDLETFLQAGSFAFCENPESRHKIKALLPEPLVWKLFLDIATGLNHLHHSGILHRDLKPQNVLLQCSVDAVTERPTANALLCDFGTSHLKTERAKQRSGFTGTVEFTAPELLTTDASGAFGDDSDEKSDVWSLGLLLFWMAFGFLPWVGETPQETRKAILEGGIPAVGAKWAQQRSPDLVYLVDAMLQRNPTRRPSLDEIFSRKQISRRMWDSEAIQRASQELAMGILYSQGRSAGIPLPNAAEAPK